MSSAAWRLFEEQLRSWFDQLIENGCTVIAPVEEDSVLLYQPIPSADRAILLNGHGRRADSVGASIELQHAVHVDLGCDTGNCSVDLASHEDGGVVLAGAV